MCGLGTLGGSFPRVMGVEQAGHVNSLDLNPIIVLPDRESEIAIAWIKISPSGHEFADVLYWL